MAIPWSQIVKVVPTILSVSTELLQQARASRRSNPGTLEGRLAKLEENERRQADLVEKMAQQIAAMTEAAVALRRQFRIVLIVAVVALLASIAAIILATT